MLSAYGANFAVTNNDQQTAMHLTLPSSNLACIRFLGQRGANNWYSCYTKNWLTNCVPGCPAIEVIAEGNIP